MATEDSPRMTLAEAVAVPVASDAGPCGLTAGAREAANLLGILPQVERLMQLNKTHVAGAALSDEELALKVSVLDKVLGGSLEVRMVTGRLDRELAWSFSSQGMLQARRQKELNYLFTANFMQGGTLGVLSGPQFLHGNPRAGTELLLLASSIGLGLSTVSFYVARTGSKKIDGGTTLLADVFRLEDSDPAHRADMVFKYLDSAPPGTIGGQTRIQDLMERWKKSHHLKSTEEKQLQKLAAIQPSGEHYRENIGLLNRRIRMLFDTQWTIEQLDADLLDLMRAADSN